MPDTAASSTHQNIPHKSSLEAGGAQGARSEDSAAAADFNECFDENGSDGYKSEWRLVCPSSSSSGGDKRAERGGRLESKQVYRQGQRGPEEAWFAGEEKTAQGQQRHRKATVHKVALDGAVQAGKTTGKPSAAHQGRGRGAGKEREKSLWVWAGHGGAPIGRLFSLLSFRVADCGK